MNLINPLASGLNGAANGSVDIYKRGTTTRAQQFTKAEGDGAFTPSASTALDANGRAIVYVNESVDCLVRDSNGNTLTTFTVMDSAPAVEVRSPSFTGIDYSTAQSAAGNPEDLETILDLWKTNSGAIDWKVLFNGAATTLQSALSNVAGLYFNVKATVYGGKGDGIADDGSAIAAAIAACVAAGGGVVYFPAGVYRVTSAITMTSGVSFLGAGPKVSAISIDHATNDLVTVAAGTTNVPVFVDSLTLQCSQANTGKLLKVALGTTVHIRNCAFGGSTANGKCISYDNASTRLTVMGCVFILGSTGTTYGIYQEASTPTAIVIGCRFIAPTTFNGAGIFQNAAGDLVCVGNIFDCSGTSSGAGQCVFAAANAGTVVAGNRFVAPTGGTIVPVQYSGGVGGNFAGLNSRTQSAFWSLSAGAAAAAANTTHEGCYELDRDVRSFHQAAITVSPTSVDPTLYGIAEVYVTTNVALTINGVTPQSAGQLFTLVINNDNGVGSGTMTLGTGFKGQAPFTVAANNVRALVFRSYENRAAGGGAGSKYWGFVGSTGDVTP